MFYKIGSRIESFFEFIFNGWKGWAFSIIVLCYYIFFQVQAFYQVQTSINLEEIIYFGSFCAIVGTILFLRKKFLKIRKVLDFIQNCVTTFVFSYGFVSALTIASYYLSIAFGLIDFNSNNMNQGKAPMQTDIELVILMVLVLIVIFAFNPTSLMIKGYMQRYDDRWKTYDHSICYFATLIIVGISSIWLIWIEYIGVDFPVLKKEYIKVIIQTKFMVGAFILHFCCILYSAYKVEQKYIEK